MYVTVEEAKEHLKVYFSDRDEEIARMIDAAEAHVANFLDRDLSELLEDSGASPPDLDRPLKANVKLAILMHVEDFWSNRGITVTGTIVAENKMAERILHFERKGLGV